MNSDHVPYQEDVTRGELRHALRGYNALGYPPAGYVPAGNGMVTIIIMAPPQATIPDWRAGAWSNPQPATRQAWPALDPTALLRWLPVLLIVAGLCWTAYAMFGDKEAPTPASQQASQEGAPEGSVQAWLAGLLPWAGDTETAAGKQTQTQPQPFRWPWEAAMDAAQEGAEAVQNVVTIGVGTVLLVLVLLIILALVNKRR